MQEGPMIIFTEVQLNQRRQPNVFFSTGLPLLRAVCHVNSRRGKAHRLCTP